MLRVRLERKDFGIAKNLFRSHPPFRLLTAMYKSEEADSDCLIYLLQRVTRKINGSAVMTVLRKELFLPNTKNRDEVTSRHQWSKDESEASALVPLFCSMGGK
ncbi:hypothetical protein RRG08_032900 [Elysia crispata]|uniref:Uncharacterized protein n=1 Tax=Elysia crispata TaxID=231223 RepID=A0AAE1DTA4_9GAST|nr:hypothetical protein RRG08_032900 [Elysia crispata]